MYMYIYIPLSSHETFYESLQSVEYKTLKMIQVQRDWNDRVYNDTWDNSHGFVDDIAREKTGSKKGPNYTTGL